MSISGKVSSTWFPAHERAISTSIVALAGPVGTLMGFVIPPIFVSDYKADVNGPHQWTADEKSLALHQINNYILFQNIVCTVFSVVQLIFV